MAEFKGVNKTYADSVPPTAIPAGEAYGRVRCIYDSFTVTEDMQSDTLKMGALIPKGARVLNAQLKHSDLGTGCTLDFGWDASSDGVEVADTDGFMDNVDIATAADHWTASEQLGTAAGLLKKFTAPVQPLITFSANATATSGTVEVVIMFVVD